MKTIHKDNRAGKKLSGLIVDSLGFPMVNGNLLLTVVSAPFLSAIV